MSKKLFRLVGCGVRCTWPTFKAEILIYQLKANFVVKIIFGNITHLTDAEIRKMLVRGLNRNEKSDLKNSFTSKLAFG